MNLWLVGLNYAPLVFQTFNFSKSNNENDSHFLKLFGHWYSPYELFTTRERTASANTCRDDT